MAFGVESVETERLILAGAHSDDRCPGKVGSSQWNIWQHPFWLLATGRAAVLGKFWLKSKGKGGGTAKWTPGERSCEKPTCKSL